MEVTKEIATIMRGWAIVFIALHNFFHLKIFGLAQENEMLFSLDRTSFFFQQIVSTPSLLIENIFSFIGWTGVPVFVFLSGYGLYKKYCDNPNINVKEFIRYNYLKLFFLMLPAAIFFISYRFVFISWKSALKGCFSLTFLQTLFHVGSVAPPFWYFSLTFQLYIVYLLLSKSCALQNRNVLITIFGLFFTLYLLLSPLAFPNANILDYIRRTFIGWVPVFIVGILMAMNNPIVKFSNTPLFNINSIAIKWCFWLISSLSILFLMILTNIYYYLWILLPFVSILFFYSVAILSEITPIIKTVILWIGNHSSYIFVAHPITLLLLELCLLRLYPDSLSLSILSVLYSSSTIVMAILYKQLHIRITNRFTIK